MAQRTIAPGGGDWNLTATWVEGAVPTTSDHIVGDASSGQLTVNVNATVQYLDLSLYTNTLTINSSRTLTTALAASTTTIGSGMSFNFLGSGSSQGRIAKGAGAQTYTQNGTTEIPHFATTSSGTLTLTNDIHLTNFRPSTSVNIDGNTMFIYNTINIGFGSIRGTTIYRFVGTGDIFVLQTGNSGVPCEFIIDCSGGTATIASQGFGFGIGQNNTNITFRHLSGTIVNPKFRPNFNGGTAIHTLDLLSGTTWDLYGVQSLISTNNITLTNPSFFDNFIIQTTNINGVVATTLAGNTFNINNLQLTTQFYNSVGNYILTGLDLVIDTGTTVNIASSININGGFDKPTTPQNPVIEVRSSSPGNQSTLNVNTYNQYISRVRFTDIDCSGGNTLYGQALTLSNTTNITQYTLPPSGGSGGTQTSYTFFS